MKLPEGAVVDITEACIAGDLSLRLTFSDGRERTIDFGPFLRASAHPEIRSYLDPQRFGQFTLKDGDLVWNDYDLCFPIADLYEGKI